MEKNIFGLKYIYITQLQSIRFMLDFQVFKTILIISKFLLVLFAYNQDRQLRDFFDQSEVGGKLLIGRASQRFQWPRIVVFLSCTGVFLKARKQCNGNPEKQISMGDTTFRATGGNFVVLGAIGGFIFISLVGRQIYKSS